MSHFQRRNAKLRQVSPGPSTRYPPYYYHSVHGTKTGADGETGIGSIEPIPAESVPVVSATAVTAESSQLGILSGLSWYVSALIVIAAVLFIGAIVMGIFYFLGLFWWSSSTTVVIVSHKSSSTGLNLGGGGGGNPTSSFSPPSSSPPVLPSSSPPGPSSSSTYIPVTYQVCGDNWNFGTTCPPITANVGDTLFFNFGATHTVNLMASQAAYSACSFSGATMLAGPGGGPYSFVIPSLDAGLTIYFACSISTHCATGGMKLTVIVNGIPLASSSPPRVPSSSTPPPSISSSSYTCTPVPVTGSNDVTFNQVTGSPFTWTVNTVSCFQVGNCVQITWTGNSNDYYIGRITATNPATSTITVQSISVSPTNTGLTIPWSPWTFTLVNCTLSSSAPPPVIPPSSSAPLVISSSGGGGSSSGYGATSSQLLNATYYTLSAINANPEWQSFVISPDGTTAIGCNSNCSYTLCAIFRNNTQVFSITSALMPGIPTNLGSLGLAAISNYGQLIALGAWGYTTGITICDIPSLDFNAGLAGIYLFTETYWGSNMWISVVIQNAGGSIEAYAYSEVQEQDQLAPSYIFQLSADGTKLVFFSVENDNNLYINTIYQNLTDHQFYAGDKVQTAFENNNIALLSSDLSYDGLNLFVSIGLSPHCLFLVIGWYIWSGSSWVQNYQNEPWGGWCFSPAFFYPYTPLANNVFGPYYPIQTLKTVNNNMLVTGSPSYNNYTGSVITYVYSINGGQLIHPSGSYTTLTPFGPPFPLANYSMFGKQLCLAANGTLLYITAPSSDPNLPFPSYQGDGNLFGSQASYTTLTFDNIMGFKSYGVYYGESLSPFQNNAGVTVSYIFLYRYNSSDPTGWTFVSYRAFSQQGVTMSCALLTNTTVFWQINNNYNPIINNLTTFGIPNPNQRFLNYTISGS